MRFDDTGDISVGAHGLTENLDLDGSVETSGERTGERADGFDRATTTADHLGNIGLGDTDLDRRGSILIDNLETHGIRIIDDLNDEILDEIGDAIREHFLALELGRVNLGQGRYSSVDSSASASAAALAAAASLASCFLDFLTVVSTFSPSPAAFTSAATASVS